MNRLTICITSIGRPTLFKALESIDTECDKVIIINTPDINEDVIRMLGSFDNLTIKYFDEYIGAGNAKAEALKFVDTEYVTFLDDDDEYIPGTWSVINEILDNNPEVPWIMPQSYSPVEYEANAINKVAYEDNEQILDDLFEYDEFLSNRIQLYPGAGLIFRKDLYSEEYPYKGFYGDDIIPNIHMITKNPTGVATLFINQKIGNQYSISRSYHNEEEVRNLIKELSGIIIKEPDKIVRNIWIRCLSNLLKRINHINNKK